MKLSVTGSGQHSRANYNVALLQDFHRLFSAPRAGGQLIPNPFKDLRSYNAKGGKILTKMVKFHSAEGQIERNQPDLV